LNDIEKAQTYAQAICDLSLANEMDYNTVLTGLTMAVAAVLVDFSVGFETGEIDSEVLSVNADNFCEYLKEQVNRYKQINIKETK
jgi:hypothetical protein